MEYKMTFVSGTLCPAFGFTGKRSLQAVYCWQQKLKLKQIKLGASHTYTLQHLAALTELTVGVLYLCLPSFYARLTVS